MILYATNIYLLLSVMALQTFYTPFESPSPAPLHPAVPRIVLIEPQYLNNNYYVLLRPC